MMKQILSCPCCGSALLRNEKQYACENGHSFDIAKQNYVNLLLGRNAATHGDNALMINARTRFLSAGYYAPLAEAIFDAVTRYAKEGCALLDVGCGEGYYTEWMAKALNEKNGEVYAFDISKDAVKSTARRHMTATLFAASAYELPVLEGSVDLATLFFSPFCREELLRVLKAGGFLLMAYPGEKHLWGLKRALYDTPYLNSPEDTKIEGFSLLEKIDISKEIFLPDQEAIADLFSMTPYYYKTGEKDKQKLASLSSLTTEIEFHLCVYRKNYSTKAI